MTTRIVSWIDADGRPDQQETASLEDAAFLADYMRDAYGARDITVTDPDDLA